VTASPRTLVRAALVIAGTLLAAAGGCVRRAPGERRSEEASAAPPLAAPTTSATPPVSTQPTTAAVPPDATAASAVLDAPDGGASRAPVRAQEIALEEGRSIYYALPHASADAGAPARLVAHLHGICHPPSYSCGKWLGAAVDHGALVCPTGNARCGDAGFSPPSWEAPTWEELVRIMDGDLERAIGKVNGRHRGALRREGAILTGWSRGGFAAPVIARAHPGRWPYLVIIEANAPLSVASLRAAGVRGVALLAGEQGTELAGMRKTASELEAGGLHARLFVMTGTAHAYSADIDDLMRQALEFVLER